MNKFIQILTLLGLILALGLSSAFASGATGPRVDFTNSLFQVLGINALSDDPWRVEGQETLALEL